MRGRLVDAWLADYEARNGAFDEEAAVPGDQLLTSDPADLRALVAQRDIPVNVITV